MPAAPTTSPTSRSPATSTACASQEDGVAAVGKIAGELKGLREELRHQMTSGLRREFDTLRKDIERAYAVAAGQGGAASSASNSSGFRAPSSRSPKSSDDRSVNMLRLEIEQVKAALDTLAREETVRSVDRRWDDFDRASTISRTAFDGAAQRRQRRKSRR